MESSDEEFFDATNEINHIQNTDKLNDVLEKPNSQNNDVTTKENIEISDVATNIDSKLLLSNETQDSYHENTSDSIINGESNLIENANFNPDFDDANYETSDSDNEFASEKPIEINSIQTEEKSETEKLISDHENDSDFRKVDEPSLEIIADEDYELKRRQEIESKLSTEELEELLKKSQDIKLEGNSHFKEEEYLKAIGQYTIAIDTCPLIYENERSAYFYNRAVCLSKIDKNEEAIKDCTDAINLKSDYLKALIKRAELYEKTEKLTEALEDYKSVNKLDSKNWNALYAMQTMPQRIHEQQEKMKEDMMKQLKQLGNMVLKPFGLSTDNFQMVQDPNTGGYSVNFQK